MNNSYVLLVARQRSGTSALGSLVLRHGKLFYPGEPFDLAKFGAPHSFFSFREEIAHNNPELLRPDMNEKLLGEFVQYLTRKFRKPILFDVKYNQTHHLNGESYLPQMEPWIVRHTARKNMPIIHLTRNNLLRSFISVSRAKASGVWHAKSASAMSADGITLDLKALNAYVEFGCQTTKMFDNWLKNRPNVFTIDYSELFQQSGFLTQKAASGLEEIADLAGISEVKTDFVKLTPHSLPKAVENFDQVSEFLTGTKHEWMLHD